MSAWWFILPLLWIVWAPLGATVAEYRGWPASDGVKHGLIGGPVGVAKLAFGKRVTCPHCGAEQLAWASRFVCSKCTEPSW